MAKGDKKNILSERRKPKNPQKENLSAVDGRDTFQTPNYATELLIPFIPKDVGVIWECACGEGKIVKVLLSHGYGVAGTDLQQGINFLDYDYPEYYDAIVTNPPFSLKRKFYRQCLKYEKPFALLIPADYSGWIIDAVNKDGAEKIIPNRRIDYITPTGLSGASGHTSYYHSMWLTWGFELGRTETFVELPIEWKKSRI